MHFGPGLRHLPLQPPLGKGLGEMGPSILCRGGQGSQEGKGFTAPDEYAVVQMSPAILTRPRSRPGFEFPRPYFLFLIHLEENMTPNGPHYNSPTQH